MEHQETVGAGASNEKQPAVADHESSKSDMKATDDGIILIPQPSSDPRDPLVSVACLHHDDR